jgi:hypothetical protein
MGQLGVIKSDPLKWASHVSGLPSLDPSWVSGALPLFTSPEACLKVLNVSRVRDKIKVPSGSLGPSCPLSTELV